MNKSTNELKDVVKKYVESIDKEVQELKHQNEIKDLTIQMLKQCIIEFNLPTDLEQAIEFVRRTRTNNKYDYKQTEHLSADKVLKFVKEETSDISDNEQDKEQEEYCFNRRSVHVLIYKKYSYDMCLGIFSKKSKALEYQIESMKNDNKRQKEDYSIESYIYNDTIIDKLEFITTSTPESSEIIGVSINDKIYSIYDTTNCFKKTIILDKYYEDGF